MRAVRLTAVNQLEVTEVAEPVPAAGEVLVSLRAAALNHRDVWIKQGKYAGLKFPCLPGSDGAGVVASAEGKGDREVIINPSFDWGPRERAQGNSFSILGLPRDGTLAQRIAVPVTQLAAKPAHLSWEEAAALPLAGLTAWRALVTRARIHSTDRVLITGVGGGVALFAVQFAAAHGAEVWVTSSSPEKIARAVTLGARGGFLYTKAGWAAEAAKSGCSFDLVVDSAGGDGFNDLIDLAAPGARIVFYGATVGDPTGIALRKLFWRQISLLGTTMGSVEDWAEMTAFVGRHLIRPVVSEVIPLARAAEAFALMERGGQFFHTFSETAIGLSLAALPAAIITVYASAGVTATARIAPRTKSTRQAPAQTATTTITSINELIRNAEREAETVFGGAYGFTGSVAGGEIGDFGALIVVPGRIVTRPWPHWKQAVSAARFEAPHFGQTNPSGSGSAISRPSSMATYNTLHARPSRSSS